MIRATHLHYSRGDRTLSVRFDDDVEGKLGAEFLRVHSPSAEVRGHGSQPTQCVGGKRDVRVLEIRPVGHYAVQLVFDEGHDSGLFTWAYLHQLVANQSTLWADYLLQLSQHSLSRDPHTQVIKTLT